MSSGPRTPSPGGGRAGPSSELPDWDRLRLSLHNAIGDLLHGWGLLAAFRRRHAAGGRTAAPRSPGAPRPASPPHRHREHIEMSSFSYRVAPSSPLVGSSPALCRVSSSPVVSSLADRRQQWREGSDTDSGVCVDRDSTVGSSNGLTVWEEFDGSGSGEGHRFSPVTLDQPSWCDCCGDLLWSDTVTCKYCSYTCHQRCRDLVTLDCPSDTSSDLDLSEVTDPNQDEDLVEVQTLVRCDNVAVAEVRGTDSTIKAEMIEKYNATSHGLYMTLSDDGGSFHGFIRVHMNLFRPINIVAGTRPPSIYDVLQPEQTMERTLASFYLPRDTVKALHIDNDTTVHEVISSLLKKFKIVDDPRKFALYERLTEQGESTKVKMRRLADSERPLELALSWSHHGVVNKKFVLQENDTGDILWDNFTLPELNNFLIMLNKEEEDYKRRVRQKYTEMKRRIAEQMDQLRPGGSHTTLAAASGGAK